MKKAIIYCRVSTIKQKINGDSLENQERACRNYCKNNNIQVLGVFKEAFTGKKKIRPVFSEAINNAIENNVEYFVIFDIDRFSREGYGVYTELKDNLFKNNISLKDSKNIIGDNNIIVKNNIVDMKQYKWNIENSSEYAEVMISTQANIEGKKIIQRTIPREIELEQEGYKVRQANFGYINKKISTGSGKKTIQVKDPIEGDWIIEIFESKAKGYLSNQEIVDNLNLKGYKSRKGKILSIKQMQVYLKMPIYAGVICSKWTGYNSIRTPYEGLISIETWNRANLGKVKIIEIDNNEVKIEYNNKKEISIDLPITEKRKNYNTEYPYSKVLKCPKCSGCLTANTSKSRDGSLHYYYQCRGKNGSKHKNYTIKRDKCHDEIENIFKNTKINKDIFTLYDEIVKEVYKEMEEETNKSNKSYDKEFKKLEYTEKDIIDNIDKVINFPILLQAKNKELEEIKSKKYKLNLKRNEGKSKSSLDKFRYYSKQVITHLDKLAIQKNNPEVIGLVFDIIYNGRVEYENLNKHTHYFHSFYPNLSQTKNPQDEDFRGNLYWQPH